MARFNRYTVPDIYTVPGMQFELKLLLGFGAVFLVVVLFGAGRLSFEAAKARAIETQSSFSDPLLSQLEKQQAKFTDQAVSSCFESTGIIADDFAVVAEIGSNGQVARSWRQGDSNFVICFQRVMTEYFVFRSVGQPFYVLFETVNPS